MWEEFMTTVLLAKTKVKYTLHQLTHSADVFLHHMPVEPDTLISQIGWAFTVSAEGACVREALRYDPLPSPSALRSRLNTGKVSTPKFGTRRSSVDIYLHTTSCNPSFPLPTVCCWKTFTKFVNTRRIRNLVRTLFRAMCREKDLGMQWRKLKDRAKTR